MTNFNQNLYIASREVLIEHGVPWEKAEAASLVVAKDDGTKPNFGRTAEDQQAVNDILEYLQQEDNEQAHSP
ncbi:hypothetical protein FACHB389_29355 [Nostoc calcicola FACHB-389]|nr:hypothetical protein [Nostoc calcicola FACHB-3891]OKH25716.1 hypothetical protein FACHB389_29355 [Nostoc calcicola FACHB-389]